MIHLGLEALRGKLLYNDIVDVWIALCEERNRDWEDFASYKRFIKFLEDKNIKPRKLPVCPTGSGKKEEFEKKSSVLLGDRMKSFVLKVDDKMIPVIRSFD